MSVGKLSKMLYIRDRAKIEGVPFDLSVKFFRRALEGGVVSLFGVQVEDGEMVCDNQEPAGGLHARVAAAGVLVNLSSLESTLRDSIRILKLSKLQPNFRIILLINRLKRRHGVQ